MSQSIQAHQKSKKGKRKGKKTGWPKFQSWRRKWFSLFYDEPQKGFEIEADILTLSLGTGKDNKRRSVSLRLKCPDLLKGKVIRNLRIIKEHGTYYAIFAIEKELPQLKEIKKIIAFDPNHKNLAYGVDTEKTAIEIAAPKWLKSFDKRLDELTSKRARCNKKSKKMPVLNEDGEPTGTEYVLPSRRWLRYDRAIKATLRKRREQSKTFMYTSAHALFKRYDCVAVGDYAPQGAGINPAMRRAMNNRSLIGRWKEVLAWVGLKSGKIFMEFSERGTTRTCNFCNRVEEQGIPVEIRRWQCLQCQTLHIRDENAAINGLKKTLNGLMEKYEGLCSSVVSCSDLACVNRRWAWSVLPGGIIKIPRGEDGDESCSFKRLKRERGSSRSKLDEPVIYV